MNKIAWPYIVVMVVLLAAHDSLSAETYQPRYAVPTKQPSWKIDSSCMEELRALDQSMSNSAELASCGERLTKKSRQKLSPDCLGQLDSKKGNLTPACLQEMQTVGQAMVAELQQCLQIEGHINATISSRCREQYERYQKKIIACGELSQRIIRTCGANQKCLEEHQTDLAECR